MNAELIKALRYCTDNEKQDGCDECPYLHNGMCHTMLSDAAYALEAAEKRIARLEYDLRNSTISNPERFKIYGYTVKDLILFADMCKRNDVREADLKRAAWNFELAVRAYDNATIERFESEMTDDIVRVSVRAIPDFEKASEEMMQNCGAEMKGEQDER